MYIHVNAGSDDHEGTHVSLLNIDVILNDLLWKVLLSNP